MNNKIDWFAIPAPRDSDLAIDDRDIWIGASPALFRRVAEIMRKQIDPQRADLTAAVDAVVKSIASELRFINSRIDKLRVELNSRIGFAEERFIDGCRGNPTNLKERIEAIEAVLNRMGAAFGNDS